MKVLNGKNYPKLKSCMVVRQSCQQNSLKTNAQAQIKKEMHRAKPIKEKKSSRHEP